MAQQIAKDTASLATLRASDLLVPLISCRDGTNLRFVRRSWVEGLQQYTRWALSATAIAESSRVYGLGFKV